MELVLWRERKRWCEKKYTQETSEIMVPMIVVIGVSNRVQLNHTKSM